VGGRLRYPPGPRWHRRRSSSESTQTFGAVAALDFDGAGRVAVNTSQRGSDALTSGRVVIGTIVSDSWSRIVGLIARPRWRTRLPGKASPP